MGYGQYSARSIGKQNPLHYKAATTRRQVYPTSEIPHKWAHQTQEAARNAQGNLYFKGPTIYSYRDSWPLARIYCKRGVPDIKSGNLGTLVLTNSDRASVTTSRHQRQVNQAVRHLPSIAVPFVEGTYGGKMDKNAHSQNLKYLQDAMSHLHKEADRAMTESAVTWRADAAAQMHKDMADYLMFFGIRRKLPALLSFAAHHERARRIEHPDPASLGKRERDRAKRQERLRERDEYMQEQRAALDRGAFYRIGAVRSDWRLFGAFNTAHGYADMRRGAVMLRVNGDEIETSLGASIPLSHAPRIWGVVQKVIARGEPYQHNGHSEHAGDFRIDRIDVDGTLTAGCHTIKYSELRAMARALGLS